MATIFLGGSTHALSLLREIEAWLAPGHSVETWDSAAFYGGDYTLDHLQSSAASFDAAIFVFSDRDVEAGTESGRDKVLAELGLFIGTHGRRRAIVCWEGRRRPNNLPGVTYVEGNHEKRDTAKRKLERWAAELGSQPRPKVFRHGGEAVEVLKLFPVESYKIALQRSRVASICQLYLPYEGHMELIQADLAQMLERAGKMEILLCDPSSPACAAGQVALRSSGIDVGAEIDRSLRNLAELQRALPESARDLMELRLYHSLPSSAVYRADDVLIGGLHLHGSRTVHGPHLRLAALGSWLGDRLLEHHRAVWDDPSTTRVDLRDYESAHHG